MTATTRLDPVAEGIYRIATFDPAHGITFNQFLIADDRPALIHTGPYQAYAAVRKAVSEVIDPATLAYVVVPHFEADECGGMGRFVAEAPRSVLVCSDVGRTVNLSGWDYSGPVRGVRDGDGPDVRAPSLADAAGGQAGEPVGGDPGRHARLHDLLHQPG